MLMFASVVNTLSVQIKHPSAARYIRLVKDGSLDAPLAEFDTSSDPRVSVDEQKLSFTLNFDEQMEYNTRYHVVMEPGAVVGLQSCVGGGSPFPGISEPTEWYIITGSGTNVYALYTASHYIET